MLGSDRRNSLNTETSFRSVTKRWSISQEETKNKNKSLLLQDIINNPSYIESRPIQVQAS